MLILFLQSLSITLSLINFFTCIILRFLILCLWCLCQVLSCQKKMLKCRRCHPYVDISPLLEELAPLNDDIHHTLNDVGLFYGPSSGVWSVFFCSTNIKPSTKVFLRPSCSVYWSKWVKKAPLHWEKLGRGEWEASTLSPTFPSPCSHQKRSESSSKKLTPLCLHH